MHLTVVGCAAGLALVVVFALSATLSSDTLIPPHGCLYDDDSIDPIEYRFFSVGSDYVTAFEDGEAAWDSTSAPGYFREKSTSVDPEINVQDNWRWGTWDAKTTWQCDSDDTYSGNEVTVEFNTRVMDYASAREKEIVAMHELGHAYGLRHATSTDCTSVMTQSEAIFDCDDLPAPLDVDSVADLY